MKLARLSSIFHWAIFWYTLVVCQSCSSDNDCASTEYCYGGFGFNMCSAKEIAGASCFRHGECANDLYCNFGSSPTVGLCDKSSCGRRRLQFGPGQCDCGDGTDQCYCCQGCEFVTLGEEEVCMCNDFSDDCDCCLREGISGLGLGTGVFGFLFGIWRFVLLLLNEIFGIGV